MKNKTIIFFYLELYFGRYYVLKGEIYSTITFIFSILTYLG